jgi:hypothetical protein
MIDIRSYDRLPNLFMKAITEPTAASRKLVQAMIDAIEAPVSTKKPRKPRK